eukprot:1649337-Pyramimonas_sp.AAC.1
MLDRDTVNELGALSHSGPAAATPPADGRPAAGVDPWAASSARAAVQLELSGMREMWTAEINLVPVRINTRG